ncbi:hypothetical protein AWB76_02906 [Caballeronia temeraria]|uniref:DUF3564 family protein n=1 Tax=Caballeronia temeraria TaxID=1777137 RepID=A0A158ARP4_9BURK|nr:DUF3564 family protein [Caballeronia temeraria]SAK60435.1 hypothetical protein AWB76_02906 [Caballeronia temeraria]
MRITIKLDTFARPAGSAYAVLWLDLESGRWSREAHECIELPTWGTWERVQGGLLLRGLAAGSPVVMLDGLKIEGQDSLQPATSQRGHAEFYGPGESIEAAELYRGVWHIQCIDRENCVAEHEIFSDEPNVAGGLIT